MATDNEARLLEVAERLRAGQTIPADEVADITGVSHDFTAKVLQIHWDSFALERVEAHIEVDERLHQPFGIVHGGVWCSIVESLGSVGAGLHVIGTGKTVVGVGNSTNFIRAHRTGRVDAVATPVHIGRTQQLWKIDITRAEDGKLLAQGNLRAQNVEPVQVGA